MARAPRSDITAIAIGVPVEAKGGDILAFRVHAHADINALICEVPQWANPGETIRIHSVPYFPDGEYGPLGLYDLHILSAPPCRTLGALLAGFQGCNDVRCNTC